jgi:phosphatidate cytidylyltransferase
MQANAPVQGKPDDNAKAANGASALANGVARIKSDGANLRVRFLTAIILAPIVIAAIILSPWGLLAGCVFVSAAGLLEFLKIVKVKRRAPHSVLALFVGGLVWIAVVCEMLFNLNMKYTYAFVLAALPLILMLMLYRRELDSSFTTMGHIMLGWAYVLLPAQLFFVMSFLPTVTSPKLAYDWQIPIGILLLIWGSDVAAYFVGKAFGRNKLFPRISPGKTWEGFTGATLFILLVGWGMNYVIPERFNWVIVAGIVAVFGTYGDLVESMLKRNIGVKDSGGILPGHGGILDRFDGFFLAVPIIFLYLFYGLG